MTIRPATIADCTSIATIWNQVIRDTAITFNPTEKSADDVAAMIAEKEAGGYAVFVASADDGNVRGFATYGQFRGGAGYRFTAEHTVILAPEARGKGLGRDLMRVVEDHARDRGIHTIFAGVSSDNPRGVAFHTALGYDTVAVLPEVGFKFGRWLDLTLMQKKLSTPDSARTSR